MATAVQPRHPARPSISAVNLSAAHPPLFRTSLLAALMAAALSACGGGGGGADGATQLNAALARPQAVEANLVATIDDFDDRTSVSPWTFWAPSGSAGSLAIVAGNGSANALGLGYSFSCASTATGCGQYVTATRNLPSTVSGAKSLRFVSRSPASAKLSVRVVDASGQTLAYNVTRPPEGYDASTWFQTDIDLAKPAQWWGGANNGVIQTGIRQVVAVANAASWPASGTVSIDSLRLLSVVENLGPVAVGSGLVVDDFENRAVAAPWTFYTPGSGAAGAVASATGSTGRGLGLDYDLTCPGGTCGKYVQATLPLYRAVSGAAALTFQTRSESEVNLTVRVTDQSGQTLQYTTVRPNAGYDPAVWWRAVVDLAKPALWWGGVNTGKPSGAITSVAVMAERAGSTAVSGTLSVDEVKLLPTVPDTSVTLDGGTMVSLDNFNDRSTVAPWSFWSPGTGASGSLASITNPADGTRALGFNYSLSCVGSTCGSYVVATLPLAQTVSGASWLRARVKLAGDVGLTVRIGDTSGQMLDYKVQRPLEAADPDRWFTLEVDLTGAPSLYWGGANSGKISGAVKSVALIVGDALSKPASGTVAVDDLRLSTIAKTGFTLSADSALLPPLVTNDTLGRHAGLAVNPSVLPTALAGLDKAAAAGFTTLRSPMFWSWIEKTAGVYDWSLMDKYLAAAEARGLTVLFTLSYGNPLYDVRTADGAAAFARYARAAAARYAGRKVQWEIWNEPDTAKFWAGTADEFNRVARGALAAIRAVDADVPVTTGGISGWWGKDFLVQMLSGGDADGASAVAMHGYRTIGSEPETLVSDWLRAETLSQRTLGRTLPMWNTEWGYSTDRLPTTGFAQWQAVYSVRQMLTQWTLGIPLFVHYSLFNYATDLSDPENNYGLLLADGSEKPAMQAVRTLLAKAAGHVHGGLVDEVPIGMHALKLQGTSDDIYVVWSTHGDMPLSFSLPSGWNASATDMNGAALGSTVATVNGTSLRSWTFQEVDGPVYVRVVK
ncbi:cellulase family glycosylhydrolase [Derxia gummosa]|uniref:Cellulase family glycosylhydrolase n=1 Tax=Derxia gummosa DSM 723 TaxID=1121388 RepID=A0A8B6XAP4_9BURK|nr:cellulase family glycosylhydrolase [Derxia gummosa]